jgi:hypothetical protein
MLPVQTQARETLQQQGNGDLHLGASERRSEAIMCTAAEGEVCCVRPFDEIWAEFCVAVR